MFFALVHAGSRILRHLGLGRFRLELVRGRVNLDARLETRNADRAGLRWRSCVSLCQRYRCEKVRDTCLTLNAGCFEQKSQALSVSSFAARERTRLPSPPS